MNNLVDKTWICKYCGAFNAGYLQKCGKCNEKCPCKENIVK